MTIHVCLILCFVGLDRAAGAATVTLMTTPNSKKQATSPARIPQPCVVYVDADNQPYTLAAALLSALAERDLVPSRMRLFGNNAAFALTQWHATLLQRRALTRAVDAHPVPPRPQAADAALMLALGEALPEHRLAGETVVVVSRDQALLACADRLRAMAIPCVLACCATQQLPTADVPVVALLPAVRPRGHRGRFAMLAGVVRNCLKVGRHGGYRKSDVGQLLAQCGLDRAARVAFFSSTPGVAVRHVDGQPLLFLRDAT